MTGFKIDIDAENIWNDASSGDIYSFIQSVFTHELGHSLKLNHNNVINSIMNHTRNRFTVVQPQQDDIDGVIDFY